MCLLCPRASVLRVILPIAPHSQDLSTVPHQNTRGYWPSPETAPGMATTIDLFQRSLVAKWKPLKRWVRVTLVHRRRQRRAALRGSRTAHTCRLRGRSGRSPSPKKALSSEIRRNDLAVGQFTAPTRDFRDKVRSVDKSLGTLTLISAEALGYIPDSVTVHRPCVSRDSLIRRSKMVTP
jgi:hypothetical protein